MITFKVPSEMYGVTDCVITDIQRTLKTGYAPCGSGEDYKFTNEEMAQLQRIAAGEKIDFCRELFSGEKIIKILSEHPLLKLKMKVKRVFVVGSFAIGSPGKDSDIDILLEVNERLMSADSMKAMHRRRIQRYFIKHNIYKADELHPNYNGRRIDLYFTYNADLQANKIEIL